jgi:hypothetical protein
MEDQLEEKTKKDKKFHILLILIISGLSILCILGLIALFCLQKELKEIKSTQEESHVNQMKTNQLMLSSMDWATRRQKYVLFMRDMIVSEWKRIGEDNVDISKAYNFSEMIMRNVENFPNLDPSLILSMACIESAFGEKATSVKGAQGMLQIMSYTARPYFELYGMPFNDSLLYTPSINIKIAVRHFADIVASYPRTETSIAIYNGGKWGTYYPDEIKKVPDETKEYVGKVMAKWQQYKELYESYHIGPLTIKTDSGAAKLDTAKVIEKQKPKKRYKRKKQKVQEESFEIQPEQPEQPILQTNPN